VCLEWNDLAHVRGAEGPGAGVALDAVPTQALSQVPQDGALWVRVQGPEVDPDGGGAGQRISGSALPPGEWLPVR
jgi:hypothetical protein